MEGRVEVKRQKLKYKRQMVTLAFDEFGFAVGIIFREAGEDDRSLFVHTLARGYDEISQWMYTRTVEEAKEFLGDKPKKRGKKK